MADGSTVISPIQSMGDSQVSKSNHEKGGQSQADADIFDALFCKWGHDEAGEEANIGNSFDDLLWDDATAAAVAAASLGWQRSLTPFNLLSSSKAGGSEQQPAQESWQQGSSQVAPQSKQSVPDLGGRLQEVAAPSDGEQNAPGTHTQQQAHSNHASGCAVNGNAGEEKANSGAEVLQADDATVTAARCAAAAAAPVPQAQYNGTEATVAECQHLLDAFNAAQQQLNMQHLQMSAAPGSGNTLIPEQQPSSMLPQLSMQSMLHLQQQMLASVRATSQGALQQIQGALQQVQLPQQAHQQQQPVQMTSHFSQQSGSQQAQQQPVAAASGDWSAPPAVSRAAAVPSNDPGISTASIAFHSVAWQQQQLQQQLTRPVGLPAGLPYPGAGPGPGPGVGLTGNSVSSDFNLPGSTPFPGSYSTVMQSQHSALQQLGVSAVAPSLQQSLSALLTAAGGNAAATVTGSMGPPLPQHPHQAASGAAGAACMLPLPQQQLQAQQLPQPMLPPDVMSALGLGAMNQGLAQPGSSGFPPFLSANWQLHLAGLLRIPTVHTTSFLQLALMMQAAMQASALAGGNDTQQAALMAATLQGLACNMRMLMPWVGAPAWCQPQQQQQQQQLNASCLASAPMLLRQLSSSFGMCGQKATVQYGSQPQTSTTDISGQAVPGCHSHSTAAAGLAAVAMTACASRGQDKADAGVRKPKRKARPADHNRARYDGRKIRANNRMRIKGRFVKMGPDGEPILPGEPGTAELDNHTAHTHSDHEGSELTDPDTHEQPGGSTGKVVDDALPLAAVDTAEALETAQLDPVSSTPAACATASAECPCAAKDETVCRPLVGAAKAEMIEHAALAQPCLSGGLAICHSCQEGPAAAGVAFPGSAAEGGSPQQADRCSSEDQDPGHCSDGYCSYGEQKFSATTSRGGCLKRVSEEGCGRGAGTQLKRLAQQQQYQPEGTAEHTAEAQAVSTHNRACLPDSQLFAATVGDDVDLGCKRPLAMIDCDAGNDAVDRSKRQAVADVTKVHTAVMAAPSADGVQEQDDAVLMVPDAATPMEGVVPIVDIADNGPAPVESNHKLEQEAAVSPVAQEAAVDPAEAAAAIAPADYVEEQHQKLIKQVSEAAAVTTAATAVAVATSASASRHEFKAHAAAPPSLQVPQAANLDTTSAKQPLAAAVSPAAGQHQLASAALLQQLPAGSDAHELHQWNALQAVANNTSRMFSPLPMQLPHSMHPLDSLQSPHSMHPPPARPPLGFWDQTGVMHGNTMDPAHIKKPNLAALAHPGATLPAVNLLANAALGAPQQTVGAGSLGLVDAAGMPLGLVPWAVQQPVLGPAGPLPLNAAVPGAVGVPGWPLLRPCLSPVGAVPPVAGGQLMPVALPGGWPLAAAAGKWMLPRQARPKKRGGKNEGSEQTDSCLN